MTLGAQLLNNYYKNHDQKGPEVREITLEFGKKDFLPRLERIAKQEARKFKGTFYVQVFGYTDPADPLIGHVKYAIRQTRPNPEPKCLLYSYNKDKEEWKYEWMLPGEKSFKDIVENPNGFHPHLVENVAKYMEGKLV